MAQKVKKTIADIRAYKNHTVPLVCLTAYTAPMAKLVDPYVDIVLVGDSLGMVLYGMDNTLGVSIPMMIAHGQAVRRGVTQSLLVVDMPYGSYEDSDDLALRQASLIMEKTGCDAVKLEGGRGMADRISYLAAHSIPVMAHIGLLPQSVVQDGGYKVKGRSPDEEKSLIADAKAVEQAGAFAFVLEATMPDAAENITNAVSIPSIGIGASPVCDGQILVTEDMVGLSGMPVPGFVKSYDDLGARIEKAVKKFSNEVRAGAFPAAENLYARK